MYENSIKLFQFLGHTGSLCHNLLGHFVDAVNLDIHYSACPNICFEKAYEFL